MIVLVYFLYYMTRAHQRTHQLKRATIEAASGQMYQQQRQPHISAPRIRLALQANIAQFQKEPGGSGSCTTSYTMLEKVGILKTIQHPVPSDSVQFASCVPASYQGIAVPLDSQQA